jgi:hypothetical protein
LPARRITDNIRPVNLMILRESEPHGYSLTMDAGRHPEQIRELLAAEAAGFEFDD